MLRAGYNYDETVSTLRYANRAKNIKNKPKINEDPKDAMLREFQDEIARLKAQLQGKGTYDENGEWQGAASASLHAIDATRVHQTRSFEPSRDRGRVDESSVPRRRAEGVQGVVEGSRPPGADDQFELQPMEPVRHCRSFRGRDERRDALARSRRPFTPSTRLVAISR